MIKTFANKETAALFAGRNVRKYSQGLMRAGMRKLKQLDLAQSVEDMRNPPGNKLEQLSGNRAGQYSIRINRQWRICFQWRDSHAYEVEIVDYH
jgi:proteic killer suppression protein